MNGTDGDALRIRTVVGSAVASARASWPVLLALGLALFVPLGLLGALLPGEGIEIDGADDPHLIAAIAVGLLQGVALLLGGVLFAGITSAVIMRQHGEQGHDLGELVRTLPYGRLAVADVLLVVIVGVGILLLVVPGVIGLAWFCLIAPLIEHEGCTVREAYARSRALVRGHFRKVAVLIWLVVVVQGVVDALVEAISSGLLGEGFGAEWLASVLSNLLADPIFALIAVTLYIELRRREQAAVAAASPALAASGS